MQLGFFGKCFAALVTDERLLPSMNSHMTLNILLSPALVTAIVARVQLVGGHFGLDAFLRV